MNKLSELDGLVKSQNQLKKVALAAAEDKNALQAVIHARNAGIIDAVLVGSKEKIKKIAKENNLDILDIEIINEESPEKSAIEAVKLVSGGKAQILMKGFVGTAGLLKAVLNKEFGLRKAKVLSHLAIFELPGYHKLLGLTDAAMNIAPDLSEKVAIINNSVDFMRKLGIEKPLVAALTAVEKVNSNMPATIDAALLSKMSSRNQIKNCIVDGPLAFDNAIDQESAIHKGIVSDVAGNADILLAPDIEAGNMIYKSFNYFANAKTAAIILGAQAPIVLTSRADSDQTKFDSIKLAAAVC